MMQSAYCDAKGRELSKLDINVASLVKQGYITEKAKIVVLTRGHADDIERRRAGKPRSTIGRPSGSPPSD